MLKSNILFSSIIIYLGIFVGIILIFMAPDEKKHGKKYFIIFQRVLFWIAVSLISFKFILEFSWLQFLFYIIPLIIILMQMIYGKFNSYLSYLLFAIILYISAYNRNLFLIEGTLIFLYGMATGSLIGDKKDIRKSIVDGLRLGYFIAAIILLPFLFS